MFLALDVHLHHFAICSALNALICAFMRIRVASVFFHLLRQILIPGQSDVDSGSLSVNVLVQGQVGAEDIVFDDIVLSKAIKDALGCVVNVLLSVTEENINLASKRL